MARPRQKLVWSNPQIAQAQAAAVKPTELGRFTAPAARPFTGEPPVECSLHATARPCYLITNPWGGSDAEEGQVAYLSLSSYGPSRKSTAHLVPEGTFILYVGIERHTEWDGKGWSRPERPMFIVNGVLAAVTDPRIVKGL